MLKLDGLPPLGSHQRSVHPLLLVEPLLASLRVLIFPFLVATKYSSWSTSGRRYLNRLKTYFSASAGSMSSVTVTPQSSSLSNKRSRLRGLPSYMGGLMSFRSSHTAASAALETMNAGREVD